jgi:hypothetical protein
MTWWNASFEGPRCRGCYEVTHRGASQLTVFESDVPLENQDSYRWPTVDEALALTAASAVLSAALLVLVILVTLPLAGGTWSSPWWSALHGRLAVGAFVVGAVILLARARPSRRWRRMDFWMCWSLGFWSVASWCLTVVPRGWRPFDWLGIAISAACALAAGAVSGWALMAAIRPLRRRQMARDYASWRDSRNRAL